MSMFLFLGSSRFLMFCGYSDIGLSTRVMNCWYGAGVI